MDIPVPLVGEGGWAEVNGDCGRVVPRPLVGLVSGSGGLWGVDDRVLGDGDVNEGLDGVVLSGRPCGGGGPWWGGGRGLWWMGGPGFGYGLG